VVVRTPYGLAPVTRLTDDVKGALYVLFAGVNFMVLSAILKHVTQDGLPLGVVILFRSIFALLVFAPTILRGAAFLRTTRPFAHLWRSFVGFTSFVLFTYSLTGLPLGNAVALSYTAPLWSCIFAVTLLGERIDAVRFAALVGGFVGVLLIAKPVGFGTDAASLLAAAACLVSALTGSLAMLAVKRLSASEPPDRIAFWFIMASSIFAAPIAAADWAMPVGLEWIWLILLGVLTVLSQMALSRGYAIGSFSRVAPMDFARMPVALAIGFVIFAEVPDGWSLLGIAVIAAASATIVLGGRPRPAAVVAASAD
jgi:drug/metabolite transporter (DMT)-like permease